MADGCNLICLRATQLSLAPGKSWFGKQKYAGKIEPDPPPVIFAAVRDRYDYGVFHTVLAEDHAQGGAQANQRSNQHGGVTVANGKNQVAFLKRNAIAGDTS